GLRQGACGLVPPQRSGGFSRRVHRAPGVCPCGSDATVVPLALPLGDALAPGLELPRSRCCVVVAEVLAERLAEGGVVLERPDRGLEGSGKLREGEQVGGAGGGEGG